MGTEIRNGYICPQIFSAKRPKKMIEILNKLKPARVEYAEQVFAGEKYIGVNGKEQRDYSILPLRIIDYGVTPHKQAVFNLEPADIRILQRMLDPCVNYERDMEKRYTKQFVTSDPKTKETLLKSATLVIKCQQYTDASKKTKKDFPWYIDIENKMGVPDAKGEKIQEVRDQAKLYFNASMDEWQQLIDDSCRCVDVFAYAFGVPLIAAKSDEAEKQRQEYRYDRKMAV